MGVNPPELCRCYEYRFVAVDYTDTRPWARFLPGEGDWPMGIQYDATGPTYFVDAAIIDMYQHAIERQILEWATVATKRPVESNYWCAYHRAAQRTNERPMLVAIVTMEWYA